VIAVTRVLGSAQEILAPEDIDRFVREALDADDYTGKRVCVLVPDATRSCPLPRLLDSVHAALHGRAAELTFMVALGVSLCRSYPQRCRGPEPDMHLLNAADEIRSPAWPVAGEFQTREPGKNLLGHDPDLEAGQVRT
jgi:hypothetical protein